MLCWISFFADVSSEIIYPILPFLAVGAIGLTRFQLGVIEGAAVLMVAIMSAWAGLQSDRSPAYGRLVWIRLGYGLPMLARALIALASSGWMLAAGRWMERFGKGLRGAPRDALLADCVEPSQLGRAFGLHRAMDTAGALLGVVMAALLMQYFDIGGSGGTETDRSAWGLRCIVWFGVALGAIAFAITWRIPTTPESASVSKAQPDEQPATLSTATLSTATLSTATLSTATLSTRYWRFLAVLVLFSLANSSDAFLLLRVVDLGWTASSAVMIYALYNLVYALASYPLGYFSDSIDRRHLIGAGWCIYALVYCVMGLLTVESRGWIWPTLALYGLYMACTDGVGKALVADLAPKGSRGKALGFFYAATGLAQLLASAIGGLLWDQVGPASTFWMGGLMALSAAIALQQIRTNATREPSP